MYRIVVDPGVLVAALISPAGAPALLVRAWLDRRFQIVVSPKLLTELEGVLSRSKFRKYCSSAEAREYCQRLSRLADSVEDPPAESGLSPDPADDYLIALARAANADFLISGDGALLNIADPKPPILSPRDFANRLAAGSAAD